MRVVGHPEADEELDAAVLYDMKTAAGLAMPFWMSLS